MKRFLLLLIFGIEMGLMGWGQVTLPHHDPIDYTVGQGLQTQSGWTSINSGDALLITSGNLTYSGLPTSTGNKIAFDGAGIDAAKQFTQQTSGTTYYSFLLNITAFGSLTTTGGYFTAFNEGTGSNFGATVWVRKDLGGVGYNIGINPRTTAANTAWVTGVQPLNSTLWVVISYQIVSGTGNDVVKIWVNPTPGGTEPSYSATATNTGTDLSNVNRILIRQDGTSATPFIEMDEFRIGNIWSDVTPAGTSAPTVTTQAATLIGTTTATFNGNITSDGGSEITDRGFCYNTSANVTIDDNKTSAGGTAVGTYSKSFTLNLGTQYFYRAYATNAIGTTLSETEISFYTYSTEPSNHPTSFTASTISQTQIDLSFSAASTISNAAGYIILQRTGSAPTGAPADGTGYSVGNTVGDGTVAAVITDNADVSESITGLSAGTHYYFKIFPYNWDGTNSATYNYKTDGTPKETDAATDEANDTDSEAYAGTPQIVAKSISSLADTQGEAEDVFMITIEDMSTSDVLATKVTNIRVKPHTTNTADWTNTIQDVFVDDGTDFIYPTATITDTYIDLAFGTSDLNVPDGGTLDVTLYIYLNTSGIVDGSILSFMVDADNHGFTADATGSEFATTFTLGDFNSANFTLSVTATKLLFTTAPSTTACPNTNLSTPPVVTAKDANNNTDTGFTGQVTLTNSGNLVMTGYQITNATDGVATFTNLQFTETGNVTLSTTNSSGLTNAGPTDAITISVSNVSGTGATNGNAQSVLSWTNPSCYDEIMIVAKAGSAVGATPTGDGSAYAGDLAFGSGTTIDGGYVVYEGSSSPQTVTGLTNGTTYYFTFFTRKGSSWSTGVTATATPTVNTDYFRSKASGNWNATSTWQSSPDGSSGWADATITPGTDNTVYIQSGHTVTLTQNEACKDLHIAKGNASGNSTLGHVAIQTFTISVYGKLRNYYASVGTVPGTNWDTYASYPFTGTTGKVNIVGNTRNLTNTGEWGATISTPGTGIFPLEINLNSGQTITIQAAIKASSWNLSSGTLDVGTNRIAVDNGTEGQGNVTIASDATLISSVTGTGTASLMSRTGNASTGEGGTFLLNGTLILSGASPEIAMTTVTLNGTVEYNAASTQNLIKATVTGAASPNVYNDLILNGSGTKSLGFNTTVNGSLIVNSPSVFDASTFVINGSGSFDLQSGATLKTAHASGLNSSITVSGTKTLSTGANYEFSGAGAQVTGALLPGTVNNLTTSGTSQLTISNAGLLTVAGNLNIGSGTKLTVGSTQSLTVTGTLTNSATETGLVIKSDASNTGSLIYTNTGVSGTMERYLSNYTSSANGWHLLSSPINNFTIAGSGFEPGSTSPNLDDLYAWDEVGYQWLNYKVGANNITTFVNGKGYLASYETAATKNFAGTLNNADITFNNLSLTTAKGKGWHLLGNPFQAALLWNDGNWALSNIATGAKIMNSGGSYTDVVNGGLNQYIPANQGFFVNATNATNSITIPKAARVHNSTAFYKDVIPNILTLKASDGEFYVETWVQIMEGATTSFDAAYDVQFYGGVYQAPQLYSESPASDRISTNRIGLVTEPTTVPLGFKSFLNRGFTITAENVNSFDNDMDIYLEDVQAGVQINLKEIQSYSFNAIANETTNRFRLHILKSTGIETAEPLAGLSIYSFGNSLYFNTSLSLDAYVSVFNITGQEVYSTRTNLNGQKQFNLNVPTGWYVVKVMCDEGIKSEKIFIR